MTERLFEASRTVLIGDLAVRTFSPVDTTLHVALHGCRSGGDRLRWLNRLALFVGDRGLSALPHPTVAYRTWLAADTLVMTRYPPGSRYEGRFSGAIMTDPTRAGAVRSWATLVGVAPRTLWGHRTLRRDGTAQSLRLV